jgi:PAS domain-containing protein
MTDMWEKSPDYRVRVVAALREAIHGSTDTATAVAVQALRCSPYTLAEFLNDCRMVKNEGDQRLRSVPETMEVWKRIDQVVDSTLRETSVVHESVLEMCERGYVELGQDGTIIYANRAFLNFCPNVIGCKLADLFIEHDEAEQAVGAETQSGPLRLTLRTAFEEIPVNAEFGSVGNTFGDVSHYALIGDIRAYVAAQVAALQAASLGILRIDQRHIVRFANRIDQKHLKPQIETLIGRPIEELVPLAEQERLQDLINVMWHDRQGFDAEFEIAHSDEGLLPVHLYAVPEFDPQRRQIGALVFLRSLEVDRARDQIYKACESHREPEAIIKNVFEILKGVLPFDQAMFGVYADQMKYYRMLLASPEPAHADATRWFEVPPEFAQWITGEQLWEPDLEAFLKRYEAGAGFRNHPLVQALIASGIKSFLSLPVRETSKVTTVLSLMSRTRQYTEADFDMLKSLPVEQALRMARDGTQRRFDDFVREMFKRFAAAKTQCELATIVVRRLAKAFDWDHVSLFKVNRLTKNFELMDQIDRTNSQSTLRANYKQPLKLGLMGESLRLEKLLAIDDTASPPLPYPYIRGYKQSRSSLCVPIKLDGTISWMLNAEESATHAFRGIDLEAVRRVVKELTQTLDRLFQANLTQNILNLTDQGVVVVNAVGCIRDVNNAAQNLLGGDRQQLLKRKFTEFGTPECERVLSEHSLTAERHVHLKDLQGNLRPIILSLRRLSEDYDHKIWLMTDITQQDWNVERRYLRETVHDVAQQTRVPLLIAGGLIKRVTRLLSDTESRNQVGEVLEKALKQLGKADITYERLIASLVGKRNPAEILASINLSNSFNSVLAELPEDDRQQVQSRMAGATNVVAEPNAIEFVFRSIMFYLLRKKPIDRTIEVLSEVSHEGVRIELSVGEQRPMQAAQANDVLALYQEEARTTAALAVAECRYLILTQLQ